MEISNMNKLVLALVAFVSFAVPAQATVTVADPTDSWAPDVRCDEFSAAEILDHHGAITVSFPTGNSAVPWVTVDLLCWTGIVDEVIPSTDCTSQAYTLTGWHWATAFKAQF